MEEPTIDASTAKGFVVELREKLKEDIDQLFEDWQKSRMKDFEHYKECMDTIEKIVKLLDKVKKVW